MPSPPHLRLVPRPDDDAPLTIDCDACVRQHTRTCADCIVTHLVGHDAGTPVELDPAERRGIERLVEVGLVPGSRFTPRAGLA